MISDMRPDERVGHLAVLIFVSFNQLIFIIVFSYYIITTSIKCTGAAHAHIYMANFVRTFTDKMHFLALYPNLKHHNQMPEL